MAALLLAVLGQWSFLGHRIGWALTFWAGALVLFQALQKGSRPSPGRPEAGAFWRPLGWMLLLAALMRFPFISDHVAGYQIDEGLCTTDGIDYATGVMVSPFVTTNWGANASFHFWWLGQFMKIFGQTATATRAFSALISMGVLFFFFKLCRIYFGRWASLTATFLMSIGWWFLFYSLSPFQDILVAFWEVLAFYHFSLALRDGKKADYLKGGLFLAMMSMEYLPGRLGGPMIGAAVLMIFLFEGRPFLKANLRGMTLAFFTMLWWMGPFIQYFFANLDTVLGRTQQLSVFHEIRTTGHYSLFFEKWAWTFLSFLHFNPGFDMRFCAKAPMIDPWSGILFVFGILLALFHPRARVTWFLLSGLFFGMMANALAIQGPNPDPSYVNGQRYFIVVPFLFLSGAWALDWGFRYLGKAREGLRKTFLVLLVLVLGWSLLWNCRVFYHSFRDFKANDSYWGDLGFNHIQVADFLNANCPRCHAVVDAEYDSSVVRVLTRRNFDLNSLASHFTVPIEGAVTKDVLILTLRWNNQDLQERIKSVYPNAKWGGLPNPKGREDLVTIEIPKEDIQALQAGKTLGPPLK